VTELKSKIAMDARNGVNQFLEQCKYEPGDLFILGCSSSEMVGERIGKGSSMEAAEGLLETLSLILKEKGLNLCIQCCEHLNRAVVMERSVMKQYGFEEVTVRPVQHAGGSAATYAYDHIFKDPVVVQEVKAHLGMDVGLTLIGMHLKPVAVPVRCEQKTIGQAPVVYAKTRPRLIGGERAQYPEKIR